MKDNETIAILPRQFVARWKNDAGETLRIIQYVEESTLELKKMFVPINNFKELGIQQMLGNKVSMLLDEDEEGRPFLINITLIKK